MFQWVKHLAEPQTTVCFGFDWCTAILSLRSPFLVTQSPITILATNYMTLPTTNQNGDQSITLFVGISNHHLTLKMTSAQDVETYFNTTVLLRTHSHLTRYIVMLPGKLLSLNGQACIMVTRGEGTGRSCTGLLKRLEN